MNTRYFSKFSRELFLESLRILLKDSLRASCWKRIRLSGRIKFRNYLRVNQFKNRPYYLIGDIHVNPDISNAIAAALNCGIAHDVLYDWCQNKQRGIAI